MPNVERNSKKGTIKKLKNANITKIPINEEDLSGRVLAHDIINKDTGEILFESNEELDLEKIQTLRDTGVTVFETVFFDNIHVSSSLRDTLLLDKSLSPDEAKIEIYRWLRPGDPPTAKSATALFDNLFFNPERL